MAPAGQVGLGTSPHPELAIATLDKLGELLEEPKNADATEKRTYGMALTNWKPVPITLRLSPAAARRFPQAERQSDGQYQLALKEPITGWLAAWVLRQGSSVGGGPTELKDWVAKLARRVVDAHVP